MEPLLKIGELAAVFNVSVKALRLYEKKGILTPEKIDPETGYRYYSVDQVPQLNALLELQSLGFSLSEIQAVLSGKIDKELLLHKLSLKKAAWQDAITVAERKIQAIQDIANRMDSNDTAEDLLTLTEEQRAWLLVKLVCVEDLRGQSILSEAIWL
jgi:DNA-binding transcriptional MerR regulator